MFALSTLYWSLSVVLTFIVMACYDSAGNYCGVHTELAGIHKPATGLLAMFSSILLINVSIVQHRVPASYPHIIRNIPPVLTRLPNFDIVHYRRRHRRPADLGAVF